MNPVEIALKLLGLVLDLVPRDVAEDLLSKEAIRRQNAIADAAEAVKFGGE
jgi:hypothetical protein